MTKQELWALIRFHAEEITREADRPWGRNADSALWVITTTERMMELAHEVYPLEKVARDA